MNIASKPSDSTSPLSKLMGLKGGESSRKSATLRKRKLSQNSNSTMDWSVLVSNKKKYVVDSKKERLHWFSQDFLRSVWPLCHCPPSEVTQMNVQETSIWVQMLAGFKGWVEAIEYSEFFKFNGVVGHMLPYITVEVLRDELGIKKFGHRLEIVDAIKDNEMTLMNPIVVSLSPNIYFKFYQESSVSYGYENHSQWAKKREEKNSHADDVMKRISIVPKQSPFNCWTEAESPRISPQCPNMSPLYFPELMHDSDAFKFRILEDSHSEAEEGCNISTKGELRCSWIPQMELSAGTLHYFEEDKRADSVNMECGNLDFGHSDQFLPAMSLVS